jgi:hypothetical protein
MPTILPQVADALMQQVATIKVADDNTVPDFIFKLNPNKVRRSYTAVYGAAMIALSDHTIEEWKANSPVEISLEFRLFAAGTDNDKHCEDDIKRLTMLMRKTQRASGGTGEPPDLIFVFGHTRDRCRIHRLEIDPTLWDEQLRVLQANVSMTLHTLRPKRERI